MRDDCATNSSFESRAQPDPRPSSTRDLTSISLFTGAGGLDLGLEAAGFETKICVEIERDARATIQKNRPWVIAAPSDIHELSARKLLRQASLRSRAVDLIAGGPPCQPFSKAAYWANRGVRGVKDPRSKTLHAYLEMVKTVQPRVILLENVNDLTQRDHEVGALGMLEKGLEEINRARRTNYQLQELRINSAYYGVPQIRHRVFLIASIDGRKLDLPAPSHGTEENQRPFATAWDAIGDLDDDRWSDQLSLTGKWARLIPSIPEGHNYLWHTPRGGGEPLFGWRTRYWSFLLKLSKKRPSWTIQAAPGPATGPFHWRNRHLSPRELARLQTFPDDFEFVGDRRSIHRQIGNAVPCAIGELMGNAIRSQLLGETVIDSYPRMVPAQRMPLPKAHPRRPVPREYLSLRNDHADHPGTGLGPGKSWEDSEEQA